jgi:hypothetical protein
MYPGKLMMKDARPGVKSTESTKFVERIAKLPCGWEGLR